MWWNKLLIIISNKPSIFNHNKDYKAIITPQQRWMKPKRVISGATPDHPAK
jgi:hypothetical protein